MGQALTEEGRLQSFLERWVAGKIDPGGESAAARASEDKMYRFGYDWRDCMNLIELFNTCAPGTLKPCRAAKDSQGTITSRTCIMVSIQSQAKRE